MHLVCANCALMIELSERVAMRTDDDMAASEVSSCCSTCSSASERTARAACARSSTANAASVKLRIGKSRQCAVQRKQSLGNGRVVSSDDARRLQRNRTDTFSTIQPASLVRLPLRLRQFHFLKNLCHSRSESPIPLAIIITAAVQLYIGNCRIGNRQGIRTVSHS